MVYLSGWFMIKMFVLLHHSGMPCGLCSERKLYLVVLTIRSPMVKRQNRTIEQIIRALIHEGIDDWVKAIPLAEPCVNNTVAESTGVSPAAFMNG